MIAASEAACVQAKLIANNPGWNRWVVSSFWTSAQFVFQLKHQSAQLTLSVIWSWDIMSHALFEAAPDSGLEELSTWPFRAEEGAGQQIDLAKSSGRTNRRDLTAPPKFIQAFVHSQPCRWSGWSTTYPLTCSNSNQEANQVQHEQRAQITSCCICDGYWASASHDKEIRKVCSKFIVFTLLMHLIGMAPSRQGLFQETKWNKWHQVALRSVW